MIISTMRTVQDLTDELLHVILRQCHAVGSVRLVCRKWKDISDSHDDPLPRSKNPVYSEHSCLRTPMDVATAEGCLSWCRRHGHKLKDVELHLINSWWLFPSSPLFLIRNLKNLVLSAQDECGITSLEPLAQLTGLEELDISNMHEVSSLQPLTSLSRLEHLQISECSEVFDLSPLNPLSCLTSLAVFYCDLHNDLEGLQLPNLREISFNLTSFWGLSGLASLTRIWHQLADDPGDIGEADLRQLQPLSALQELTIDIGCMDQFSAMQSSSLTTLELRATTGQLSAASLCGVPKLKSLVLTDCYDFADLSPLSTLRHLEVLDIRDIEASNVDLDSLTTLTGLSSFKKLSVYMPPRMRSRVDLSALGSARVYITEVSERFAA